jgi:hypothetical protein
MLSEIQCQRTGKSGSRHPSRVLVEQQTVPNMVERARELITGSESSLPALLIICPTTFITSRIITRDNILD